MTMSANLLLKAAQAQAHAPQPNMQAILQNQHYLHTRLQEMRQARKERELQVAQVLAEARSRWARNMMDDGRHSGMYQAAVRNMDAHMTQRLLSEANDPAAQASGFVMMENQERLQQHLNDEMDKIGLNKAAGIMSKLPISGLGRWGKGMMQGAGRLWERAVPTSLAPSAAASSVRMPMSAAPRHTLPVPATMSMRPSAAPLGLRPTMPSPAPVGALSQYPSRMPPPPRVPSVPGVASQQTTLGPPTMRQPGSRVPTMTPPAPVSTQPKTLVSGSMPRKSTVAPPAAEAAAPASTANAPAQAQATNEDGPSFFKTLEKDWHSGKLMRNAAILGAVGGVGYGGYKLLQGGLNFLGHEQENPQVYGTGAPMPPVAYGPGGEPMYR
jgi:hypothetical protein